MSEVNNEKGSFADAMGGVKDKILNKLDEHPWLSMAGLIILGVGLILGSSLHMGGMQYGVLGAGGFLGMTYLVLKLLGIKKSLRDSETLREAQTVAKYALCTLGLGLLATAGGSMVGGSIMGVPLGLVGGGAIGLGIIGLFTQYRIEKERKGEEDKPWQKKALKIASLVAGIIAPIGLALIFAYMMRGGPTTQSFWYGLAATPTLVPLVGSGILALYETPESQVRFRSIKFNDFYHNKGKNLHGDSIEDILAIAAKKDKYLELERKHNYIQWLFPLPEGGMYNGPKVPPEEIAKLTASPETEERLLRGFTMMLDFYGLKYEGGEVIKAAHYEERKDNWLKPSNHNHLRISRILKSLMYAGKKEEAHAFFDALAKIYDEDPSLITDMSYNYWKGAVKDRSSSSEAD